MVLPITDDMALVPLRRDRHGHKTTVSYGDGRVFNTRARVTELLAAMTEPDPDDDAVTMDVTVETPTEQENPR